MIARNPILFVLMMLAWLGVPAWAQVSLPNGTVGDSVVDLRVKVLGGYVTVDRQFDNGNWQINSRWKPVELGGQPSGQDFCQAYPVIKIQNRTYTGDGQTWTLENRYSVRTTEYFVGTGCAANRIKTLRWQDRNTGEWKDFQRFDASILQFQLIKYGDSNNVTVTLAYDNLGRIQEIRDHFGGLVLKYVYNGDLLAEIQDNPALIPGNDTPMRRVKYEYAITSRAGQSYPVIVKATDALGNITQYTVTNGNLAAITDAEGRQTQYQYTADRVTKYIAPDGQETAYAYDYDKVKKQFYVRVTEPATVSGSRVTENWYDSEGVLIRHDINGKTDFLQGPIDTATRSSIQTDGMGNKTETIKDEFDHIVKIIHPDGTSTTATYSALHGQPLERINPLGVKTGFDYDAKGNLLKKTEAAGLPEQRVTEYVVDAYGQAIREIRKGGSYVLSNGQTYVQADSLTQYQFDNLGNRTQLTDALGNITAYVYDLQGNLLQLANANHQLWKYSYDARGNLMQDINPLGATNQYLYDKLGNKIQTTDAEAGITKLAYDASNRLIKTTNPLGYSKTLQYDAIGNVVAEIDEAGMATRNYRYNQDGLIAEESDAAGNKTSYEYDAKSPSLLRTVTYPTHKRSLGYDSRNRLTSITDYLAATPQPDTQKLVAQIQYDAAGNRIKHTDPQGRVNGYRYDGLRRLIQITDAVDGSTRMAYDTLNDLIALTDANGNTHRFDYDPLGRKIATTLPMGQKALAEWDAVGNPSKSTDAVGNVTEHQYDAANREVKTLFKGSGGMVERTSTYTYNQYGTLTGYDDGSHSTIIAVDALQRKLGETTNFGPFSKTLSITWHPTGQRASNTTPEGNTTTYAYDDAQRLAEIKLSSAQGGGVISFNQYSTGQTATSKHLPGKMTLPGGTTLYKQYDALNRPVQIRDISPQQTNLLDRSYTYSTLGNITHIDSNDDDTPFSYDYAYDDLNRLTKAQYGFADIEQFAYDAVHNRVSNNTSTWFFNANNQLTDQGGITLEYNSNGQTFKKTEGSGNSSIVTHWRYDAENRLIEVKRGTGLAAIDANNAQARFQILSQYAYDPLGRRTSKTSHVDPQGNPRVQPVTTYYLYGDDGLLAEYDSQGNLIAGYGWEPQGQWGGKPITLTTRRNETNATLETFYYLTDHLGTPQKITDQSGQILWSQTQNAFGQSNLQANALVTNNVRFPGQYFDAETNSNYNYFRDYDASTGRYLQIDPMGTEAGVNVYVYGLANPLKNTDPYGLETCGSGWNEPLVPDNPFGFPFSSCCQVHDDCYDSCKSGSKAKCDNAFCNCMQRKCDARAWGDRHICRLTAQIYCDTVRSAGKSAYDDAQKKCNPNPCNS